MRSQRARVFATAGWLSASLVLASHAWSQEGTEDHDKGDTKAAEERAEFFTKQVRPLLEKHCFKCHGGRKRIKAGLRLTSRKSILKGGDFGPAVDLKSPEKSLLLEMLSYKDDEHRMPPPGKLSDEDIETFTLWVKMGAPYVGNDDQQAAEDAERGDDGADWWAYQPLVRPAPPKVRGSDWVSQPFDAFLLARLEAKGLSPAPPANRAALIRRVYYDLIGLPPTPAEIDAFVSDKNPKAYEELIDRLLDSPRYGEKWGRHWLDLVRFAETHGYERDNPKPEAWRYRDYVIRSFNEGKPYDRFLLEQIAGDEIEDSSAESVTATGFYRLGIWNDEPADRLLAKYDVLDGILATTCQITMAMTIGCARCHDHKKDPIPQEDYYRMLAFFQDVTNMNDQTTREVMDDAQKAEIAEKRRKKATEEADLYGEIFRIQENFKLALAKKKPAVRLSRTSNPDIAELSYRFYRDTWEKLPQFQLLKHETEGRLAHNFITLEPASRKHAIGLVFEGKLRVPAAGEYTFFLDSTEGARLLVNSKPVIERSGKGRQQASGSAMLPAGFVPIRVEYFNGYEEPKLGLEWSGAAIERRSLSAAQAEEGTVAIVADSRAKPHSWMFTTRRPRSKKGWMTDEYKVEKHWKAANGGFGTKGTPGSVVRTNWKSREIWLRTEFSLEAIPRQLSIDIHHDEDAEVWINGKSIAKFPGHRGDYTRVRLDDKAIQALRVGRNLLAVYCRQTGGGQYIDVGLVGGFSADIVDAIREHGEEVIGAGLVARHADLSRRLNESRGRNIDDRGTKYKTLAVAERGRAATHVFARGSPHLAGKEVKAGFPVVLGGQTPSVPEKRPNGSTSGKRSVLARWLTSDENPMTPRALANRLWQFHFGRAIVGTPSDFGRLGELPTHPQLLDWLACEVRARGWRLKEMHKLILTSSTYRMSSRDDAKALSVDPANRLFWRFDIRRLTAEEIRDSILDVCGTLNLKEGGPSFYPEVSRDVLRTASRPGSVWKKSSPAEQNRRSVYTFIKRSLIPPMLATHDLADTDSSCAMRFTTTVPTQALTMLNSKFLNDKSAVFAERLRREAGDDLAEQVRTGLRLVTGRGILDAEVARGVRLVGDFRKEGLSAEDALKYFCLMAFNLNEFVYLD